MMRVGWHRWRPLGFAVAVCGVGCATAGSTPEGEPPLHRGAEVVGLTPLTSPAAGALPDASAPPPVRSVRSVGGPPPLVPVDSDAMAETAAGMTDAERPGDGVCKARLGTRAVKRNALARTLDAGLGTWLKGVDVEARVDRGRFQGWLVRGIYAGDPCWSDVDLRAGDVVTRINRHSIERPEEAQVVWSALRGSDEIVVEYLRQGRPRILKFAVVDAPE